jgi:hypothetical protein
MEMILGGLVMLSVPAYFIAQPAALARWRGAWRKAAMAPLALTIPAGVYSLVALGQNSNLWPLALIFAAALGTVYLALLWLVRWHLY